jgi:CheY-like chemotaxis protein
VRVDLDQAQIAFSVWDSGIGIATADHAQLFEPFTQVDRGLGRQYDGVGLGLALVRRLTELHGGSVFLESALGQGSRFTVSLPLSPRSNVALRGADGLEASPPSWPAPPRIVLVDDHAPSLALVAEWLTQQECQVATVRTGEEAVALVRATPPDVVVLDIQLPGMDGLTAIRQMRADSALAALPIIVLTALAMPGDRERCLATGANA